MTGGMGRRRDAPRGGLLLLALTLALALTTASPPPATAQRGAVEPEPVHPFYLQLLEEGIQAWQRGDGVEAAVDLRLAVFGLLEHPPELVRGLAYLALAQAASGNGEEGDRALADTLERLIVVEDRFRVYDAADLPSPVRRQLASLLTERVPERTLAASPTFRELADRKLLQRVQGMPPRERRAALEEQVARQPADPRWQLALATLELEQGEPAAAAGRAAAVLAADPAGELRNEAHCVRGRALASTGACTPAVADLLACPRSTTEPDSAAALVGCQARLGAWREAAATLDRLSPELRSRRPLERLERQVRREVEKLPPPQTAATVAATRPEERADDEGSAAPGGGGGTDPGTGSDGNRAARGEPAAALPPSAREQLQEARRRMAAATRAGELAEPLRLARQVADAHPGAREAQHLVGEIAYRASEWPLAVRYFRRGGEPSRPEHRFYLAVSLYESGEATAAADVLERALPELPRSPFVNSYVERILGATS